MRKGQRKLQLSRETLHGLADGRLERAGAGVLTPLTCGASYIHNCGTQNPECPTIACP